MKIPKAEIASSQKRSGFVMTEREYFFIKDMDIQNKKYDPQIHHRQSVRVKDYDYTSNGYYFVTICTHDKQQLFGQIKTRRGTACCALCILCALNEYGNIVNDEWIKSAHIRNKIELDEFVIMPNHIHGIIIINDLGNDLGTARRAPTGQFGFSVSGSLPTIVRAFKSASTKRINELRNSPGQKLWQRNYYEHIIRDEKDLNRIRKYIKDNPAKWEDDEYYKDEIASSRKHSGFAMTGNIYETF